MTSDNNTSTAHNHVPSNKGDPSQEMPLSTINNTKPPVSPKLIQWEVFYSDLEKRNYYYDAANHIATWTLPERQQQQQQQQQQPLDDNPVENQSRSSSLSPARIKRSLFSDGNRRSVSFRCDGNDADTSSVKRPMQDPPQSYPRQISGEDLELKDTREINFISVDGKLEELNEKGHDSGVKGAIVVPNNTPLERRRTARTMLSVVVVVAMLGSFLNVRSSSRFNAIVPGRNSTVPSSNSTAPVVVTEDVVPTVQVEETTTLIKEEDVSTPNEINDTAKPEVVKKRRFINLPRILKPASLKKKETVAVKPSSSPKDANQIIKKTEEEKRFSNENRRGNTLASKSAEQQKIAISTQHPKRHEENDYPIIDDSSLKHAEISKEQQKQLHIPPPIRDHNFDSVSTVPPPSDTLHEQIIHPDVLPTNEKPEIVTDKKPERHAIPIVTHEEVAKKSIRVIQERQETIDKKEQQGVAKKSVPVIEERQVIIAAKKEDELPAIVFVPHEPFARKRIPRPCRIPFAPHVLSRCRNNTIPLFDLQQFVDSMME